MCWQSQRVVSISESLPDPMLVGAAETMLLNLWLLYFLRSLFFLLVTDQGEGPIHRPLVFHLLLVVVVVLAYAGEESPLRD